MLKERANVLKNLTLKRIRVTIVVVENQEIWHILRACL